MQVIGGYVQTHTQIQTLAAHDVQTQMQALAAKHKEAQMYVRPTADTNVLQKQCCIQAYLMAAYLMG